MQQTLVQVPVPASEALTTACRAPETGASTHRQRHRYTGIIKKQSRSRAVVAHAFNPSTREAEVA